ncbi:Protein of unknown function, partial [Gryllus bimaculatus]
HHPGGAGAAQLARDVEAAAAGPPFAPINLHLTTPPGGGPAAAAARRGGSRGGGGVGFDFLCEPIWFRRDAGRIVAGGPGHLHAQRSLSAADASAARRQQRRGVRITNSSEQRWCAATPTENQRCSIASSASVAHLGSDRDLELIGSEKKKIRCSRRRVGCKHSAIIRSRHEDQ